MSTRVVSSWHTCKKQFEGKHHAGHGEGSIKAILYAPGANAGIAIAKGAVALWTGSGAMLAEEHCAALRAQLICPKPFRNR